MLLKMNHPKLLADKAKSGNHALGIPMVSVVIPSFNHSKFIRDAILSIENQTYKNIEIIIVDDGSTDDSIEIINMLLPEISRSVKFFVQKNSGAHATINFGISQSNGEFITILNSDDLFSPIRIGKLVDCLLTTKRKIVVTKVSYIDENGRDINDVDETAIEYSKMQNRRNEYPSIGFSLLDKNIAISTGNLFFTKSLFNDNGGFSKLLNCHDWDFLIRSLRFDEPIFIDEELYYYRLHSKNAFKKHDYLGRVEGYQVLRNFYKTPWTPEFTNSIYPCKELWPDYFPAFIKERRYEHLLPAKSLRQRIQNAIYFLIDNILIRIPG